MRSSARYRCACLVGLATMVIIGVAKTKYNGWENPWLWGISGDVLYEMAWIWFVGAWKIRWPVRAIAIATFVLTSLIEVSQLIAFPESWTTQLWWRLLLGTHFSWADFLYYAAGCWLGAISLSWLRGVYGLRTLPSENSLNQPSQAREL